MRRPEVAAALLLLLPAFGGPAAPAAETVEAAVTLRADPGRTYEGHIAGSGEVHDLLLEDIAPREFSVALAARGGSDLLPDLTLLDPSGADVTDSLAPYRRDGRRSVSVKGASFPSGPGRYALRVSGREGTYGHYVLRIEARTVRAFRGTGTVPGPSQPVLLDPPFLVPTGATATVRVLPADGSGLVPRFLEVAGNPCLEAPTLTRPKPGTAEFVAPFSAEYEVSLTGEGGTTGAFEWTATVKPARTPGTTVSVNIQGPTGRGRPSPVIAAGQAVAGLGTDGGTIAWREVRTAPDSEKGKNYLHLSGAAGKGARVSAAFATETEPDPRTFALGGTHAAAMAGGALLGIDRSTLAVNTLGVPAGPVLRVLADRNFAYTLESGGIRARPFLGGIARDVAIGGRIYTDMAFGGLGLVYGATTLGGDLQIRTVARTGEGDTLVTTLSPGTSLHGIAARGADVLFAASPGDRNEDGIEDEESWMYRASACHPGPPVLVSRGYDRVRAMAADELAVYALVEDIYPGQGNRGIELVQWPRGRRGGDRPRPVGRTRPAVRGPLRRRRHRLRVHGRRDAVGPARPGAVTPTPLRG